jgi:predicted membrane channel-forming protein YqfA (hemolysin III family)
MVPLVVHRVVLEVSLVLVLEVSPAVALVASLVVLLVVSLVHKRTVPAWRRLTKKFLSFQCFGSAWHLFVPPITILRARRKIMTFS